MNSGKERSEHLAPESADSDPIFVLFAFFAVEERHL
jgi:hypothetical protein